MATSFSLEQHVGGKEWVEVEAGLSDEAEAERRSELLSFACGRQVRVIRHQRKIVHQTKKPALRPMLMAAE